METFRRPIRPLAEAAPTARPALVPQPETEREDPFVPPYPRTIQESGIEPALVEEIVIRSLLDRGACSGRDLCRSVCLGREILLPLLDGLRKRALMQHRGSDAFGDFVWELSEAGRDRAVEFRRNTTYTGPAPVPFEQYLESVRRQTVSSVHPGPEDLKRAFGDLVVPGSILESIGPALSSGKGLFIYGSPGNGKTSIAERITAAYGGSIWIPYTLVLDGILINLFDPTTHKPVQERPEGLLQPFDHRWVLVQRPTVIAGGELSLEMLDLKYNAVSGVCDASLQLRANCGSLVIDDFGRQLVDPNRLLNRWIVPLERRVDYLRMPNSRKVRVPFDVVLIFSTNMEPRDLVDEAFLRRIPYKVEMPDPTEEEFRRLLASSARAMGVGVPDSEVWSWLIDAWYRRRERPMRFCHPRDLLNQVLNICRYERRPPTADQATLERGAKLYFAGT